jgi:hypothetical protein
MTKYTLGLFNHSRSKRVVLWEMYFVLGVRNESTTIEAFEKDV